MGVLGIGVGLISRYINRVLEEVVFIVIEREVLIFEVRGEFGVYK